MPWKYGNVTLKEGVGFTAGSIKHPANWNVWTDTYKKDVIGLTWSDTSKPCGIARLSNSCVPCSRKMTRTKRTPSCQKYTTARRGN